MRRLLPILGFFLLSSGILAAGERDIVLKTPTGDIWGSILTPQDDAKDIIVLFISASGPTDRNGNQVQMQNNAIKFLAEELCDAGIPSVRYDKRGIAASTTAGLRGEDMRFSTSVDDARSWIDFIAKDYKRVVVAGHSEGAQIGVMATVDNPHVSAVISLAGSGRKPADLLRVQLGGQSQQILEICEPILQSLENGITVDNIPPMLFSIFRPSVQPYVISWFATDPAVEISKLEVPVLIIQGDKDIQIAVEDADLLAKAQPKAVKVVIAGMNHVFKECDTTDPTTQMLQTYMNPDLKNIPSLDFEVIRFIKGL
ncbi:MAG: lysophospholipase [Bacteroidales bacterium]|nr:lysophospholipase [Bacteroidales bacterium]